MKLFNNDLIITNIKYTPAVVVKESIVTKELKKGKQYIPTQRTHFRSWREIRSIEEPKLKNKQAKVISEYLNLIKEEEK